MKRLERLATISFATITISLVFHLLAMSSSHWIENICLNCSLTQTYATWGTALRQRCYISSIGALVVPPNASIFDIVARSFIAEICLDNKILKATQQKYALDCLITGINRSHVVCAMQNFDHTQCYCDYTGGTKGVMATTIIASLILGVMMFISHSIAYIRFEYILVWLFPLSLGLLGFAIFFIIATLVIFSANKHTDVDEIIYSSTLMQAAFRNDTSSIEAWRQEVEQWAPTQYNVKIGWCFGMEILSLQFLLASTVIFILMFMAKNRPEPKQ